MKVYVATVGDYSSYSVVGVFSTRVLAEEKTEEFFGENANDPIEMEIDEFQNYKFSGIRFTCQMLLSDGSIVSQTEVSTVQGDFGKTYGSYGVDGKDDLMLAATSHVSAAHAVKLAAEERQERLRQKSFDEWVKWYYKVSA